MFAQEPHCFLKFVLRRRRDTHLVRLYRGLHFLELVVLDELDDVFRGFGGNPLLQRDDAPHGVVGGAFDVAGRQVLRRNAAADHAALQDLPERVHLELVVGRQGERVLGAIEIDRGA